MSEPLAFRHGATTAVFAVAIGGWLAFEFAMRVRQRLQLGHRPARDPSWFALTVCLSGSVYAAIALGRSGPASWPGGPVWPFVAGIVLIAAGVALRAWSIATLGRFFQYRIEVQAGHRVVTDGPYR